MASSEPGVGRQQDDGHVTAEQVTIPPNTTATVHVPSTNDVSEGERPVDEAVGVEVLCASEGETVLSVGSGRYEFAGKAARV